MELADKNIIVTGCASGMGAATVRAYVGAGAQVVGMDIVGEAGEQATGGGCGEESVRRFEVFGDLGALTWKDLAAGLLDCAHVQTAVIETRGRRGGSTTGEVGHPRTSKPFPPCVRRVPESQPVFTHSRRGVRPGSHRPRLGF